MVYRYCAPSTPQMAVERSNGIPCVTRTLSSMALIPAIIQSSTSSSIFTRIFTATIQSVMLPIATLALRIEKKRGKLTLAANPDLLMYEESQRYCVHYAIILNCSEATVDGGGLYLEEDQKGDVAILYQIEDGEICPVCGKYTPPFKYYPNCGTAWEDMDKNVEKLISAMWAEAEREIRSESESKTRDGRLVWY